MKKVKMAKGQDMKSDKEILKSLQKGKDIEVLFYGNDEEATRTVRKCISECLKFYEKTENMDIIYACTKELLVNASRANLKRAFFIKQNLDFNDMGQYVKGLSLMRNAIDSGEYKNYSENLKPLGLWVKFILKHSDCGIEIEVINATRIIEVEEKRIRMKLDKAMKYNNMAEFYHKEQDESEGAGMGIAIIVNLLKSAGIHPGLFRIYSEGNHTVARVEIPFTGCFTAKRVH